MKIPGQGPGQVVCPAPSAGSMARAGSQAGHRSRARAGRDQAGRLAVIGVVTEDNRPRLRHRAGGAEGVAIIDAAAAGGAVADDLAVRDRQDPVGVDPPALAITAVIEDQGVHEVDDVLVVDAAASSGLVAAESAAGNRCRVSLDAVKYAAAERNRRVPGELAVPECRLALVVEGAAIEGGPIIAEAAVSNMGDAQVCNSTTIGGLVPAE